MEDAERLRLNVSTSFLSLIRLDAQRHPMFSCRVPFDVEQTQYLCGLQCVDAFN